ncbi:hypothetical protein TPHA_0N01900 [Tetrapisispora phaffii CBS 4417]|uniref:Uncharacterized protein n=1 Tax=Tetrapisispora phaffii (strain ATCC 24235 / CBS 4417 / NBRC 1672 / NRRL Y-8282 / UCD 70-5) TaxID=1071381 RepID=G8C1E3_TETPH|nr:hypothetical protein TPHA_0N01900 [Tetrapisispora phaffii CBS 4417]CCE65971.1 hypothetical protein TPHA_0N01900 [Tetrapisispora phaffii CBS 4417]
MVKVVIVTGASRGIGRSIVDQVLKASDDAVVCGVARSEAPLKEIKSQYGDRFDYTVGDITDAAVLNNLVKIAIDKYGKIDSVIANAGVLDPVQNINEIKVDEWKKLYNINFFSIVELVSITLPYLKKGSGEIVFVSSDASDTYFNSWGAYGSSKAALNHFAMTIAAEEPSVKAVSIAPGIVDTNMQVSIRENFGPQCMSAEATKMFTDLHKDGKLVHSDYPASVYAKLAVFGIPEAVNGKYLSYDDAILKDFQLK